ncbi:hypothetical protein IV203_004215 [Nitzschia inconspicua]|uniref:Uncharacterized protein n=1 Tax=Nitzschia inconspicua TaxID=303405 RepID=A0A9K3L3B8_9STRA|nr:hypothetical protein IV203_004215 [Nitzschia inconspicua]
MFILSRWLPFVDKNSWARRRSRKEEEDESGHQQRLVTTTIRSNNTLVSGARSPRFRLKCNQRRCYSDDFVQRRWKQETIPYDIEWTNLSIRPIETKAEDLCK